MKKENILVTGGAGFIGSFTCEELLKLGYKVVALDNFNDYYNPKVKEKNVSGMSKNPDFKLYKADITDFKELQERKNPNSIGNWTTLKNYLSDSKSLRIPDACFFNLGISLDTMFQVMSRSTLK